MPRKDGHKKWADFAAAFWHCACVSGQLERVFAQCYTKWWARVAIVRQAGSITTIAIMIDKSP